MACNAHPERETSQGVVCHNTQRVIPVHHVGLGKAQMSLQGCAHLPMMCNAPKQGGSPCTCLILSHHTRHECIKSSRCKQILQMQSEILSYAIVGQVYL